MMKKVVCLSFVFGVLVSMMGCGATAPTVKGVSEVKGKVVSSKGTPLRGGRIVLKPAGGLRPAVSAHIALDGSFSIDGAVEKTPVLPGSYQVFVVFGKDPQHKALRAQVPRKYQSIADEESDLFVTIGEEAKAVIVKLGRS